MRSDWLVLLFVSCAEGSEIDCKHGVYNNATQNCQCFDHWATAGITDTVDFLEGVCEQYRCQSDQECQRILNIGYATCPIKGWNCYCGWEWAVKFGGHGWETPRKDGGGECMGVMYTFSVWATLCVSNILATAWMFFLPLAVICLPFGKKRSICDHRRPSFWNWARQLFGCQSECRGACVMNTSCTLDSILDNMAWTVYVLDLGIWFYMFMSLVLIIVLFIWSIALWIAIFIVLAATAIAGMCAAMGDAGSSGDCCTIDCCNPGDTGAGLDCCCFCPHSPADPIAFNSDAFYISGAYPSEPCYCGGSSEMDRCSFCCCLQPLAWLIFVFPAMPENAWGGFFGYFCFGTHILTPTERLYQGGNYLIEFFGMSWRRRNDLHSNEAWRALVRDFLLGESPIADENSLLARQHTLGRRFSGGNYHEVEQHLSDGSEQEIVTIGRARAIKINRSFDESDGCVPSSFEDYLDNKCWICMSSNVEWDLWLSCHHLFCSACSTVMLQRSMPCPLCRVSSSVVKRGHAALE